MRRTRNRAVTSSARPEPARPDANALAQARDRHLRDVIRPGLDLLFVGINPGLYSGATGHHFARPGNRFWPVLYAAGFTPRLLQPAEQEQLLDFGLGVSNLVNRTTATADELDPAEFVAGRRRLAAKVRRFRPRNIAFLGIGAYQQAFAVKRAAVGEQREALEGAQVWVLPNPSGLNANYQLPALVTLFRRLRSACVKDSTAGTPHSRP